MKHLNDMKKILMLLVMLCISLFASAQETAEPSYNAHFTKEVSEAHINDKYYTNVFVEIESSQQGYTTTYNNGWVIVTHPWVKIKVCDSDNKKIYSKKLKRSKLYIFDTGKNIQIGQANMTTEAILKKTDYGWTLDFDEKGDL